MRILVVEDDRSLRDVVSEGLRDTGLAVDAVGSAEAARERLAAAQSGREIVHVISKDDLASGQERVLVDWPALNYDPVYSPDGSEIAFASTVAGKGYEIYRQRLADGKASRVTFDGGDARYPDYRPPGR